MKLELFKNIKENQKEFVYLAIIFIIAIITFKIIFYKTDLITVCRSVIGFFWLYLLPGFFILTCFEKLNFIERLSAGGIIGYILITLISYYLGILGININYLVILPGIIIAITVVVKRIIRAKKPQEIKSNLNEQK